MAKKKKYVDKESFSDFSVEYDPKLVAEKYANSQILFWSSISKIFEENAAQIACCNAT